MTGNDVFNLLGVDDVVGQVIIDLGIGQVALLLTAGNQVFQLSCLLVAAGRCALIGQNGWPPCQKYKRLIILS